MNGAGFANSRIVAWLAIALATGGLLWLLSRILAPFLTGAILAYILNPLVDRLARRRVPRTVAVVLVLLLAALALGALLLVVLPLFYKEMRMLADQLPAFLGWLNGSAAPWIRATFHIELELDLESLSALARDAMQSNQDLLPGLLGSIRIGGMALVGVLVTLLLIPVVLFFLLRDWHVVLARLDRLVPRGMHRRVRALAAEIDAVLAEFLRGQLLVMLMMSVYYVLALTLARLEFALPVGLITGMLVFIPYIGAATGILLGTIAALLQFDSLGGVALVWLAFGLGQLIEGMLVTPLLVGKRIGLHPVAVIFALLAFGEVFGFFGVLLALPASAALLVGLRHMHAAYLASELYRQGQR